MVKISSKQAETLNKKIIPNNNIGCRQKIKREMEVVDFLIRTGQQGFEAKKNNKTN